MRIASLSLQAFGAFQGLELDFEAPGLHVVFGPNEAGKSTTLRAITSLLYGIDVRTTDAHQVKPSELRIGGTLTGANGERMTVVRRKGVSKGGPNTLLDVSGKSIDEAVLQRMLGGVTEHAFTHAFGLDLERLHAGARALLAGGGDVAGSLFDASLGGGSDARALLAHLSDEAEKLYKPRGTTPSLNVALKAFSEAQKKIKEKQRLPETYTEPREALEAAKKRRFEIRHTRAATLAERQRLERAQRRFPLEAKRAQLTADLTRCGASIAKQTASVTALHARLGAYEHAITAHRDAEAELERLRVHLASAESRAGEKTASAARSALASPLDARGEARIQAWLDKRSETTARLEKIEFDIARDEREVAQARALSPAANTQEQPEAREAQARRMRKLERALTEARGLADTLLRFEAEHAKIERRRREVRAMAATLAVLQSAHVLKPDAAEELALEAFARLAVPSDDELETFSNRMRELERARSRHDERTAELDTQARLVAQQIAENSGDFAPPAKSDLDAARAERDAAWTRVRDVRASVPFDDGAYVAVSVAFERALREADGIADRMIAEADRVTARARLQAQKATLAEQCEIAAQEGERLAQATAALENEHETRWATCGIRASSDTQLAGISRFAAMRSWRHRFEAFVTAFHALSMAEHERDETAKKLENSKLALKNALGESDANETSLSALTDHASLVLERAQTVERTAAEAARTVAMLQARIDESTAARTRDESALAEVNAQLGAALAPFGLPQDAAATYVRAALEAVRALLALREKIGNTEAQRASSAAYVREFEQAVTLMVSALAPDLELENLPPRDAVTALASRANEAHAAESKLAEVNAELDGLRDDAEKEPSARESDAHAAVERTIEDFDAQLADLERQENEATHAIGGLENKLAELRLESGATEAAAEAQAALARVRSDVDRYVRVKTAAMILASEIERYREENQGPLLTKASVLFAKLTLGSFSSVRAAYDEKDALTLACMRSGKSPAAVDVAGLSEGTRDQLYLSLRLASLWRYIEVREPLPLVLDDILVQFDDARARAALEVLAELATRMQVLFFTHHARLVEIALAALPHAALTVHDLKSSA